MSSTPTLWERDGWDLADAVRAGTISAVELLEAHLERIGRLDPELNSVCHLDAGVARVRAAEIDAEVAAGGDPGPLAGVPVGVKELASVAGWPETHASVIYADCVADRDDTEVERLRAAGAVITGLTMAALQQIDPKLLLQLKSLGASRVQLVGVLLWEARLPLLAAVIAGFGAVISEVGAVMMVGGNLLGHTRVLTTATVLETRKGNFEVAIALGILLLVLTFLVTWLLTLFQQRSATR